VALTHRSLDLRGDYLPTGLSNELSTFCGKWQEFTQGVWYYQALWKGRGLVIPNSLERKGFGNTKLLEQQ
jgi:hypothetical protein